MNTFTQITHTDLRSIIRKIERQRTLVVLGPQAFRRQDGTVLQTGLKPYLEEKAGKYILKYYPTEDFYLFNKGGRTITSEFVATYYEEMEPDDSILKLAQIPFHIYLTFTPGLFVPKAFEQEGFSYQFDFANKSAHQPSKIKPPTGQQPLIYNLFGSITEEESLILTHNDLYAYFKSVFERRSMPTILREALEKVNCFIFLGLPFEKWYMQMLLRELGIHKSSEDFIRFAAKQSLSDEIMTFCYDQFTINFVDHHVEEFIDLLYDHSSQAGILRNTSGTNPAEQLKVWIGEGKTEKILENLQQYLPKSHEWEGELLGLSSRHKRLNRRNRNGVITAEEFDVGLAQINQDILEIINEAL